MHASLRLAITALISVAALAACSKPDAASGEVASTIPEVAASGDDPCAIVSKNEVRAVFPGAEAGKRNHTMDQYGMASCTWELPTSKLAVQIFTSTNTAGEEVRGRMLGFLDPLQPGLRGKIQYDTIAGLGDEAVAVAVKADQAQGILADTAMLGIRKGSRMAVLFTSTLVDGDPAASKKALQALGGSAASRL